MKAKTLKRAGIVLTAAIVLLAGAYRFGVPWFVRREVRKAMLDTGLTHVMLRVPNVSPWQTDLADIRAGESDPVQIENVSITYTPGTLLNRQVQQVRISGLTLTASVRQRELSLGALDAILKSQSKSGSMPIARIEIADSAVKLNTGVGEPLRVPVGGEVVNNNGSYELSMRIALQPKPIEVHGTVSTGKSDLAVKGESIDLSSLAPLLAQLLNQTELNAGGSVKIAGRYVRDGDNQTISATVEPRDASISAGDNASIVTLVSGVYSIEQSSYGREARTYALRGEKAAISVGHLKLTGGTIAMRADKDGTVVVENAQFSTMGGQIGTQNARIDPKSAATSLTLACRYLQLEQVLKLLGEGKVAGDGRVSGTVPVIVQRSRFQLGQGNLVAEGGGVIQVASASAIAETSAKDMDQSIRQQIAEALEDFQFTTLRADIRPEGEDVMADVHLAGQGRRGAKKPLDIELRVSGVNSLLRVALGLKNLLPSGD